MKLDSQVNCEQFYVKHPVFSFSDCCSFCQRTVEALLLLHKLSASTAQAEASVMFLVDTSGVACLTTVKAVVTLLVHCNVSYGSRYRVLKRTK